MKILYITTVSSTMTFFIPHINMLLNQGHQVDLACNYDLPVNPQLLERGCKVFNIVFQRSPVKRQNYMAYKSLKRLINDEKYDLVHTHTPIASACARLACRSNKNVKLIYTAHGFHFFKGAPILNWLLYYPVERWLSRYTDVLITINKEDYTRAKKSFKAGKVEYIPGVGLDIEKFSEVNVSKSEIRKEINVPDDSFLVLSVGELNKNKNHETIIKAIARLNNPNIYYVICGIGPLEEHLRVLIKDFGLNNQIKLLGYRNDIGEICYSADVFAFPSKREGLGLAALEAMTLGLPIITSNVHGIVDYSVDGVTGYTCGSTDIGGFAKAIEYLINNRTVGGEMGQYNKEFVKRFNIDKVKTKIESIYKDTM